MGMTIVGLAIDKNYSSDIDELQKLLNTNWGESIEVDCEDAFARNKPKDTYDLYFSEEGTLILMDIEDGYYPYKISNHQALSFVYDETSMMFMLDLNFDSKNLRNITELNGDRMHENGTLLPEEKNGQIGLEKLIPTVIKRITEIELFSIEPDEVFLRFKHEKSKIEKSVSQYKAPRKREPTLAEKLQQENPYRKAVQEQKVAEIERYQKWKQKYNKQKPQKQWWEFWK